MARLRRACGLGMAVVLLPEAAAYAQTANQTAESPDNAIGEEIIVTAQKRSERLQNVPISITALSGADLDAQPGGGVSEALRSVAGVSITSTSQGGATQLTIRGVSASNATLAGSSTAAFYIDAVPFGLVKSAILPDASPFDLQRIEILRGPQGTLYGANALNGVVRILTNDADLDEFELKTRAGVSATEGGAESYRGDLAVNIPLVTGALGLRLVAGFENGGGWIEQPARGVRNANDQQSRYIRGRLNAQITDELNVGLAAWISRISQDSPNYASDQNTQATTVPLPQQINYDSYSARVTYDFGSLNLSSSTSYLRFVNEGLRDYTSISAGQTLFTGFRSRIFTEELLLNSASEGMLRWSVGGFYRNARDRLNQTLFLLPAPINTEDRSRSYAAFGQVTLALLDDRLELTGGLRYFNDRVSQIELTPASGNPNQPLARRTDTFNATTPRFVVTWLPSRQFTAYASYSQGFRSGFNQSPSIIRNAPGIPPVDADRLSNYEVGAKGNLFGGVLNFDAALYYIDWTDIQQNIVLSVAGVNYAATVNGAAASGLGVDLAVTLRPTSRFSAGGTFSWNGLELDDAIVTQTPAGPVTLYERGERLTYSPAYTASAFLDYRFPVGAAGLEGQLSGSLNYRSRIPARVLASGVSRLFLSDAPLTARASLGLTSPRGWTASIFIDNITNWDGVAQPPSDPYQEYRLRPRTVGLQFEFRI